MPTIKRSDASKIREIRRAVSAGVRDIEKVSARAGTNRSTRSRHELIAKAAAFDRVQDVLKGRR